MVMRSKQFSNIHSGRPSATLGTDDYAYNFDNIGNRITAAELADEIAYEANNLNQYTSITKDEGTAFIPTFDDDGNQLTVKTATGLWNVTYNAENRPVTFTQGTTVIECKYDSQGRRFEKKVTVNGTVTFWQRYAYRGYLQIAAFNVTLDETDEEIYTLATTTAWDPMEQTATRPLAFTDHTAATPVTYFYTHDLTKNVCELLSRNGSAVSVVTEYDYTPFGAVTASNSSTPNTFMFSSEVYDPETALVYYNYRHYNPLDGRWINRDPIGEDGGLCLYLMINNKLTSFTDVKGLLFAEGDFFGPHGAVDTIITSVSGIGKTAHGIVRVHDETNNRPDSGTYDQCRFDEWHKKEKKKLEWLNELNDRPCPPKIQVVDKCPKMPGKSDKFNPDLWYAPGKANEKYHPNASYEMRSLPTKNGHGNQCTYDKNGNLLDDPTTQGGAPGSADKVSPDWKNLNVVNNVLNHYMHDVLPYELALKLDGGQPGNNVRKYYEVRPSISYRKM